jgi:hypothetical protein
MFDNVLIIDLDHVRSNEKRSAAHAVIWLKGNVVF